MNSFTASLVRALVVCCAMLSLGFSPGNAQYENCPCIGSETTYLMNLCINGVTCEYSVTMCRQTYSPGSATAPCASVAWNIDSYIQIKKICRTANSCFPLVTDVEVLITAIMCELNPIGKDFFNVKSAIPDCDPVNGTKWYSMVVATPYCMKYLPASECYVSCNTGTCCLKHYAFCKDAATGVYNYTTRTCDDPATDCPVGTNFPLCQRACPTWNPNDCPTCN